MLTELHGTIPLFWVHQFNQHQLHERWSPNFKQALHLWELCWRPKTPLPGPGRYNGNMGVLGIQKAPIALFSNVLLEPCLPPSHRTGCLCSRTALILHSPGLGSVQHLKNLIQSYGLYQVTPAIVCAGA